MEENMMRTCDACQQEQASISIGGAMLCRRCDADIKPEIDRLRAEGKPVSVINIARAFFARKNNIYTALKHLSESIKLMEATKGAFKSAQIAEARSEVEKAKEILEKMM